MRIIWILVSLLLLLACEENDRMAYVGKPGVYFENYKNEDTIKYSFNMTSFEKDTLLIDVKLMGVPLTKEQSFCLKIDPTSTAKEGIHYVKLPERVTFPIGKGSMQLPLILCDEDPALDESSVFLGIHLAPSEDIEIGFPGRAILNVSITNMLIKPEYWDKNFIDWFGEYSKVKHEKFIEMAGHDFPLTYEEAVYWNSDKINLAYWQFAGRKLADYFVKNPTKDEHGNLIDPWEPA